MGGAILRRARAGQDMRYPDISIVIDLSRLSHLDKDEYLRELLPTLAAMRVRPGCRTRFCSTKRTTTRRRPRPAA
jgi:hypothetical protein